MHTTIQTHRCGKLLVQCSEFRQCFKACNMYLPEISKKFIALRVQLNLYTMFSVGSQVFDVLCSFAGRLWPRLTSKIGELPSQFDALVSEELRDACRAASEADKTREIRIRFSLS